MTAPILDAFLERPREGLCAPNIANNISNSHRALVQKITFWLPFGLHFGAFSGPFWLFWRSRGLSKIRCKKRLPKKQPRDRKWPTMASQMGSHICRQAFPLAFFFATFVAKRAPRAQGCPNDAPMAQNCAKIAPKWSKTVAGTAALTRQLSARSPNKRCQEFCDSCALTASNRQATLQTHTRTHHTHPQYTHTAQQTRHSRHSTAHTAQHNPR